jgi:hypothetical protein
MLLTNRRVRMLHVFIAGMDAAWLLPLFHLIYHFWATQTGRDLPAFIQLPPLFQFTFIWLILLLYMLLPDLLGRAGIESPRQEVVLFFCLLLSSLIWVRLVHYHAYAWYDPGWLGSLLLLLVNLRAGAEGELLLLLVNLLLWWRVAVHSGREISFFSVSRSFRAFFLVTLLISAILAGAQPAAEVTAITFLAAFFLCGLVVVAIARIDQKALGVAGSAGALLPWRRVMLLLLVAVALVGSVLLLSTLYNPANLGAILATLGPLWTLLSWIIALLLAGIIYLLMPLIEWLARLAAEAMADLPAAEALGPVEPMDYGELTENLQNLALVRYCMSTLIIVALLALVWVYFQRSQQRSRSDEQEEEELVQGSEGGAWYDLGAERLRKWLARFRTGTAHDQLLATVTVQNMYANLSRLARRRGFPRRPAQSPDRYLPELRSAFPGHSAELTRLTQAYMQVDYGERPITEAQLATLQQDYAAVLAAGTATDESTAAGSSTPDVQE